MKRTFKILGMMIGIGVLNLGQAGAGPTAKPTFSPAVQMVIDAQERQHRPLPKRVGGTVDKSLKPKPVHPKKAVTPTK